jgi:hypothetical protein
MSKLQKQIENKLEKLSKLLDNIAEAQIIVAHEPETWDSDTLYNLVEQLKEALKLLENQKATDKYGDTITLEPGICSLVDAYQSEEEEDYD